MVPFVIFTFYVIIRSPALLQIGSRRAMRKSVPGKLAQAVRLGCGRHGHFGAKRMRISGVGRKYNIHFQILFNIYNN